MKTTRTITGAAVPLATALATVAAAGICLTACGAPVPAPSTAKPPVSATPENTPDTSRPSASATPENVPPDPTTSPTAVEQWCDGTGYTDWSQVAADVTQMHSDTENDDMAATDADGSQLEADAAAAVSMPPPFSQAHTADYLFAMTSLRVAGANVVDGNLAGATSALQTADGYIGDVSGLVGSDCLGS